MTPLNDARTIAAAKLHDCLTDAAEATTAFDTVNALAPAIDAIAIHSMTLFLDTCKDLGYTQLQDLFETAIEKLKSPAPDTNQCPPNKPSTPSPASSKVSLTLTNESLKKHQPDPSSDDS